MSNMCFSNLPINRLAYESTIFLIIAVLFIYITEIAYIQSKKSLRIPKVQSESVYRRRTDNTTANRKSTKWLRSTKHTHKTIDRVTRTPLKTVGELGCHGTVSSSCSTSGTRLRYVFPSFPINIFAYEIAIFITIAVLLIYRTELMVMVMVMVIWKLDLQLPMQSPLVLWVRLSISECGVNHHQSNKQT